MPAYFGIWEYKSLIYLLKYASILDLLKRIIEDRRVHEFRYTFITRAKECGVNPEVIMVWSGHEFDSDVKTSRVDRGYTTYSDEYLFREASKVRYEL